MHNENEHVEKIVQKIQKLLALSNSPNENEAAVALKKARELMLKHHIEQMDLDAAVSGEKFEIKNFPVKYPWMLSFWGTVCRNHRCEVYLQTIRERNAKVRYEAVVYGYPFDIECVAIMMDYIIHALKVGIQNIRKEIRNDNPYADTTGIANTYRVAFLKGLEIAFEEQQMEDARFALMCVTPKEVKEEFNKLTLKTVTPLKPINVNRYTEDVISAGKRDGYNAAKNRQIEA